ncbi:hypothetical protein LIS82_07820 [Cytobacillus solani]|uniref:hypothetical protein n=1 Tax=Cytobacillus solani TaxID=1637975 RepID=UPI002079D74D|nr:hypothetical protein [Cytobacillus solani]USK56368.1 hypothetical protein LIS82_07820 [Cytobacillus solani]
MNEENQNPITEDSATESGSTDQPTTENTANPGVTPPGDTEGTSESVVQPPATTEGANTLPTDVVVTSPIDNREQTIFRTGDGEIHVIHEITLGDVVLSTLIMALLVFMVLEKVIRR